MQSRLKIGSECPTCFDDGRLSLAREIRVTLSVRGFWVPNHDAPVSDLIGALAMALDKNKSKVDVESGWDDLTAH